MIPLFFCAKRLGCTFIHCEKGICAHNDFNLFVFTWHHFHSGILDQEYGAIARGAN